MSGQTLRVRCETKVGIGCLAMAWCQGSMWRTAHRTGLRCRLEYPQRVRLRMLTDSTGQGSMLRTAYWKGGEIDTSERGAASAAPLYTC